MSLRIRASIILLVGTLLIPVATSSLRGLTHVLSCKSALSARFDVPIPAAGEDPEPVLLDPTVITRPAPGETTVPATTAPPTTLGPIDLLPPVAIGESVMLGAAPQLNAGGVQVNAAVSRQGSNLADVVGMMRAAGQLGRTVVIQTGTNGSVSDTTLDRIMSYLPADQTPLVVFLTVHANRAWIADNNIRIKQLPDRYPNVKVVDWDAESAQVAGELASDGYHLRTPNAKQFYANMIFTAIGRPDLVK